MKETFSIASELPNLEKITHWLIQTLPPELNDKQKNIILLLTQELATNAILHGNKESPQKQVIITLFIENTSLSISIQDEGTGLDSLPTLEEAKNMDYLEENGRGLKLAVMHANEIHLNGNEIKLYFDTKN